MCTHRHPTVCDPPPSPPAAATAGKARWLANWLVESAGDGMGRGEYHFANGRRCAEKEEAHVAQCVSVELLGIRLQRAAAASAATHIHAPLHYRYIAVTLPLHCRHAHHALQVKQMPARR